MLIHYHAAPSGSLVMASLLTLWVGTLARADTAVPLDTAIEVMETLAGRIGSARWKVETAHGLSENGKFNAQPFGSKGDVIFEPATGRYRAHLQSIVPAAPGPSLA